MLKSMKLLERITVEPDKCGGRPCIRGMRIRVTDILGMLAEGVPHEEILQDFPYLEPDDIKAALAYALGRRIMRFCNQRELSRGCPTAASLGAVDCRARPSGDSRF
jgi:uncharacterized protein (DUF433 family)